MFVTLGRKNTWLKRIEKSLLMKTPLISADNVRMHNLVRADFWGSTDKITGLF